MDFGQFPTTMTYTRSQNNTKIAIVGEHGIQTFKVVVVVLLLLLLSFDVFVPTSAHPLFFKKMIFLNISNSQYSITDATLFLLFSVDFT